MNKYKLKHNAMDGYIEEDIKRSNEVLVRLEALYGRDSASYLMEEHYNKVVRDMVLGKDNPED